MSLLLDHLAVSALTRDAARAYVEEALGLPMQTGGEHAFFGTHNHLMGMQDGLYLEAISINPQAPKPDRPRWFNLDAFSGPPRLTNWICACTDLESFVQHRPDYGDPVALQRGELNWHMAVPASGLLPFEGVAPALIKWQGSLHPAKMLTQTAAQLHMLTVHHPQADLLQDQLGPISGGTLRFEKAAPALTAEFQTPHGLRVLH